MLTLSDEEFDRIICALNDRASKCERIFSSVNPAMPSFMNEAQACRQLAVRVQQAKDMQ